MVGNSTNTSNGRESPSLLWLRDSFSVFYRQILEMSKNVTIEADLCQVLDDFLLKLSQSDTYLANGIYNTNFAEAGLLLQSSADLYGKKVDMLWDIIIDYQKRIVLYDEKNGNNKEELEKLEERKRKYKRKKKVNTDESEAKKLITDFCFGGDVGDNLSQNYETNNILEEWAKFTDKDNNQRLTHTESKSAEFLPKDNLYNTDDNEYIGRYDQFHSASLVQDMFHLESQNLLRDEHSSIIRTRIDCHVVSDFLRKNAISCDAPLESFLPELHKYVNKYIDDRRENLQDGHVSIEALKQICLGELQPGLGKNWIESCQEFVRKQQMTAEEEDKKRRLSMADSLFDSQFDLDISNVLSPQPDAEIQTILLNDSGLNMSIENQDGTSKGLEVRNKSCSQDSAFFDCEDENVLDELLEVGEPAEESPQETELPPQKEGELPQGLSEEQLPEQMPPVADIAEAPVDGSLVAGLMAGSAIIIPVQVLTRTAALIKKIQSDSDDEPAEKRPRKKPRLSEKRLIKLVTGVTTEYKAFERFYREQYQPSENEGKADDSEISDDEDDDLDNDDDELLIGGVLIEIDDEVLRRDLSSPELPPETITTIADIHEEPRSSQVPTEPTHTETSEIISQNDEPVASGNLLSDQSRLALLELYSQDPVGTGSEEAIISELPEIDFEQEEASRRNIKEWRKFILPKIRTMENRSNFDIHEYGSKILENHEIGQSVKFDDLAAGKSAAEVTRYFIASLQLANTRNIEIKGNIPGQLANDTLEFEILDKTKHHELLEDYQAPSEETFRERLEQANAMSSKAPRHSTPYSQPPKKKLKIVCSRTLFH